MFRFAIGIATVLCARPSSKAHEDQHLQNKVPQLLRSREGRLQQLFIRVLATPVAIGLCEAPSFQPWLLSISASLVLPAASSVAPIFVSEILSSATVL